MEVEILRGASRNTRVLRLSHGARVRDAVRAVGHSPEGCAVLIDEKPVPMDRPISDGIRVQVVPTYSGG